MNSTGVLSQFSHDVWLAFWGSHKYLERSMSFGADPSLPSDSLASLQRRFEENPRRYFAPLANEYRKAGDFVRALEICRGHLPHQPGHLSGYVVYAQTLFDAGQLDEAAAIFEETLRLDPENIVALQYAGDIARSQGNRDRALSYYERALGVDPANEVLVTYVAELQEPESEQEPEAAPEEEAPQEQELSPPVPAEPAPVEAHLSVTSPFVTETMAELYLQQGFVQEALLVYKQLAATRNEPRFHQKVWELEGGPRHEPVPQAAPEAGVEVATEPASEPVASESVRDFFARLASHPANTATAA